MACYYVRYNLYGQTKEGVCVGAKNKYEAYDKAVFSVIPMVEGAHPFSAWVSSVTYNNGNYREFPRAFEGNPFGE